MFFLSSINKRFLHYLSSEKRERGRVIFLNATCPIEKEIDALLKHQTIERRRDSPSINEFNLRPGEIILNGPYPSFTLISDGAAVLRYAF
jgi:hypothetical protein